MAKFFVTSDIHSFYDEMKSALDDAGFDQNNDDHWLIVCGDCFDRGPDSAKVLRFLKNLKNKVLIKGNHEQLLVEYCKRGYPQLYDIRNGTHRTVTNLGYGDDPCSYTYKKVKPLIDSMVNYFETKNYIFVHSWIPTIVKDSFPKYHTKNRDFEFDPNWRNADDDSWDIAMWGNPFAMVDKGLLPDKTIVFGHWHCSTGWAKSENRSEFGEDAKFDPYYGDGYISVDACTAHSGKCNVIVIEDEPLEG